MLPEFGDVIILRDDCFMLCIYSDHHLCEAKYKWFASREELYDFMVLSGGPGKARMGKIKVKVEAIK